MPSNILPLPATELSTRIDPAALPFASTAQAEAFIGVIGQQTARDAIAFGVAMTRPGYNIFVMGAPGTGRLSLARHYLEEVAKERETPCDWLYLNHFAEPREPLALALSAGIGRQFLADLERLVDSLAATFPAAFEHPAHQRGRASIEREFAARYDQAIAAVERQARQQNVALFRDGESISFAPMLDGKAVTEDEFAALAEAEQNTFHDAARQLEDYLAETLVELPQWRREMGERLRRLNYDTLGQAIEPLLAGLAARYAGQPQVLGYLDAMRKDLPGSLMEHAAEDRQAEDEASRRARLLERYAPKLLVSHAPDSGAPVIFEANPTYQNLFGKIEYSNEQGVLATHHRLICPGALHQANGGYLLLEADRVAEAPEVWPALKRALKSRLIRIDPPPSQEAPAAVSLNPEPVPLALKIVLVGEREWYYLMQAMDDEFNELFRVPADFDDCLPRNGETVLRMAGLLKAHVECSGFAHLSAGAFARLLEFSGRLAEHQHRLSARIGDLCELVAEAELVRQGEGAALIEARHVAKALADKEQRLGRISRLLLQDMLDGSLLVSTDGEAVGMVNGLTVLDMGGSQFGVPARITATVAPGGRGVVDIERESRLGQAIHSKGVMILAGYLAHQYAKGFPLQLSANIALEQSYGYVDGDSASLAELLALVSALTGVPLRQGLAVTGSINQYGEVQAVGGVNEKVEGFFRLCEARGLTGGQGVLIPQANAVNLMLGQAPVEAAGRGEFAVYAVASVDEALQLLTGKPADTVNRLALAKLRAMAKWAARRTG